MEEEKQDQQERIEHYKPTCRGLQCYKKVYKRTCKTCGVKFKTANPKIRHCSNLCTRRARKTKL